MARPSKLTDRQWDEVARRALAGEKVRPLAREFGVTESAIRQKISAQNMRIKTLAEQKVRVEQEIRALPVSSQTQVSILAEEMMAISTNLAHAGKFGSLIARRSLQLAHKSMGKVDEDDPMESAEILQGVAGLTRIANEASAIGTNLLRVNKEKADTDSGITIDRSYG